MKVVRVLGSGKGVSGEGFPTGFRNAVAWAIGFRTRHLAKASLDQAGIGVRFATIFFEHFLGTSSHLKKRLWGLKFGREFAATQPEM